MRVHVIGIGGYGMRALAHVLLDRGVSVCGSDVGDDAAALDPLRARGAHIWIGHDAQHVAGADVCVYSSAIDADNVERVAAQEMGICTMHRAEMLAQWLHESECSVTVTGAHGKTTTSAMIATICTFAQADPTFVIGADLVQFGRASKAGNGRMCIAEADESDNTFVQYRPDIAVITNVEPDHLENYDGDFQMLIQAYQKHISNVRKTCIVCIDDPLLGQWVHTQHTATWVTYGVHADAHVRATDIVLGDRHIAFSCMIGTALIGRVHVPVSGMHNVQNALGAIAAAAHIGIAHAHIVEGLEKYRGTKRRFEVHYEDDALMVIDDYAHHPTEIQATIRAARATHRRVIAVFEPQRYTRTARLFEAFAASFDEADVTIITDIYAPAGEHPIEDVDAERLVARINQHTEVYYAKTYADAERRIDTLLRHGDVVLTMGAGPIYRLAHNIAKKQNALHRA